MITYNDHMWFQTSLYDLKIYPIASQDFPIPGPETSKIPQITWMIAFNFGQFSTYFDREINIAEMLTMDPNILRESIWMAGTIQFAFKHPI